MPAAISISASASTPWARCSTGWRSTACAPFGSSFLIFSDYMRPPMRLASMMRLPVIYVFTHDSIGLGEDGPTHQPVEQLIGLRAVPGLIVIRPADANEVVEAWRVIVGLKDAPACLVLSRQPLPTLDRSRYAAASGRGARRLYFGRCAGRPARRDPDRDGQRSGPMRGGGRDARRREYCGACRQSAVMAVVRPAG